MGSKIVAKTQFEDDYKSSDYSIKKFTKSRTDPSGEKDANITNILRKFQAGIPITHLNNQTPRYGDFTAIGDYASSMEVVFKAEAAFSELPAHVRKKFDNDPAKLLDFIADSGNYDEALKLGLVNKRADPVVDSNIPQNTASAPQSDPQSDPQ